MIHYEDVDGGGDESHGYLVYLKSSLTGHESADVLSYSREHIEFPHDATTNQWFSESRFESYRKLGSHVAREFLREALQVGDKGDPIDRKELIARIRQAVNPRKPPDFYDA